MMSRVTIYFDDEKLRTVLEVYCKDHHTSFSKSVLDFTAAGYALYEETGSLDTKLLTERAKRFQEAKKEIEFLRGIIRSNADQINQLLGIGTAPVDAASPPPESVLAVPIDTNPPSEPAVAMAELTQKQESLVANTDAVPKKSRRMMRIDK